MHGISLGASFLELRLFHMERTSNLWLHYIFVLCIDSVVGSKCETSICSP